MIQPFYLIYENDPDLSILLYESFKKLLHALSITGILKEDYTDSLYFKYTYNLCNLSLAPCPFLNSLLKNHQSFLFIDSFSDNYPLSQKNNFT
jgi:hypothetical protein